MKRVAKEMVPLLLCPTALCFLILTNASGTAWSHCDTMSGPVVTEAKTALEKGDVTPILKWIPKEDEEEIKTAFVATLAVRIKGPEAKTLADRYFIETLVRLHRAGEGEPYTGIKDAPVDPIVAMADKALTDGIADEMVHTISRHMAEAIREKLNRALSTRRSKDKSVAAGRGFVEAYVTYLHYIEGIHTAILSAASHHQGAEGTDKAVAEQPAEHKH
jgi:hypothetical protein